EAGSARFVPVVLTSATTIGGLLPLTIGGGTMWAPMGWGIMWQDFTLELTQDAVVGEVESEESEIAEVDIDASPEQLAQRVRDLEQDLHQSHQESERLRTINQRWAQLAGTDRLTELPNKLSFLQALVPQEIQQAQHDQHPVGFMLISGDNLGPINEQYGRDAGDSVIVELSHVLQSVLKGEELLGHLDGTNFAVSMYPATLEGIGERAEEIRALVADHSFSISNEQVSVTVSVGIMSIDSAGVEDARAVAEESFGQLNGALFEAKRAGGDRVEEARLNL
ncbi:MAG: diguanylate cyclase, partial [Candidatus Latescibacteria bacterium]|nr:diguanylate cyclase [Candidatus Latescibacterota bacterium]